MTCKLVTLFAALALAGSAQAGVLAYSGYLQDGSGDPVTVASTLTFRFYPALAGGLPVWEDTVTVIPDATGWFSALLGASAGNPLDAVDFTQPLWLALQVATDAQEMVPRTQIGSAPYALTVGWDGVLGKPASFPVDPAVVQSRVTGACEAGQFITGVNQDGTVSCGTESATTYTANSPLALTGNAFGFSSAGCASGAVWKWTGAVWSCEPDAITTVSVERGLTIAGGATNTPTLGLPVCATVGYVLKWNGATYTCQADADSNTTYSATGAIALSGTTFSLSTAGCAAGDVWKWNGTAWSCEPDDAGDMSCTWAVAAGASSATSQTVSCPAARYPVSGGCEGAGSTTVRINRPGGPPANGADLSTVSGWYCEFSAAATGHRAYALCCGS